jgi:hypothetical protein
MMRAKGLGNPGFNLGILRICLIIMRASIDQLIWEAEHATHH